MLTKDALWQHVEENDLCPGVDSIESWLEGDWLTFRVAGRLIPILPMWGLRNALTAHDVHHMLTGYDTSIRGEAMVCAWELASGGCGFNLFFWIDRLLLFIVALLILPAPMFRAFRGGLGKRNLYRTRRDEILSMDVATLRRRVGIR